MDIGNRLRITRQRRNLTFAFVGEVLNKTEATIQRYESGNIRNLKIEVIEQLAILYGVTPAYLMGWENEGAIEAVYTYKYVPNPSMDGLLNNADAVTDSISLPDALMDEWARDKDVFILRILSNEVDKLIPPKSLIAVKITDVNHLDDDDIIVYCHDGELYINHFYNDKENNRYILKPNSTDPYLLEKLIKHTEINCLKLIGKVVMYIVKN